MDYSLTEDQAAIAELAEKIFREQVNDTAQAEFQDSFNTKLWQTLADAGLTGLGLAEQNGGSAMGFIAQCLVVQAQGAVLAQIPLPETLLAAQALEAGGISEGLPGVAAGDAWLSLSLGAGLSLEGDTLQGELGMVPWAEGALYLVARAGERLVAFAPAEADVELIPQRVSNGRPTCQVLVRSAKALDLGGPDTIARLHQRQQVMTASLQLGVAEEALKRTAAYTSERKQFGKPLAAFQAVAHRAADSYMDIEALRGVVDSAMWRLEAGLDATLQSGAARWWATEASHRVSHTAQHLHGGIGSDLQYPIHRYFLWSKQLEFDLGGAAHELAAMGRHLASNDQSGITL
ncbi:acyl-CoA dehydrogenase family protein [Haliea sp. E1-2-M8]|uniref:acyl-CoA dehydrogenase family protein n=1 Tax=Haliea sp. E1-2-M8 TaxID=3064706 RepID=UPI002716878F|nr:acyl-CoA dehydrogenase family protein [Haliea sp. E1-2-M8]MDO8862154.1 acyl-CoA dehydrogenase family protein [Haliea sp. E1-2-M8]